MASFGVANPALGAGGGPVSDAQRAKALEMARSEMEYRVELFNKMTGTCFEKCTEKRCGCGAAEARGAPPGDRGRGAR